MLEIKNLHKSFEKKEILHGVNIQVNDGEIFGFIGHNGAGKTTTIRCATGILDFENGEIYIDGIDVKKNPIEAKKRIAYLPDNPDLYESLTAVQYLNFISDIFGISEDVRFNRMNELAKEFELYDVLGDQIKSYSHGMKQKLALISAFIHDPKLIILDEPFVGLDPKASFLVKEKLKQLCSTGCSVFFSSHVLEVVENLCNQIAIISNGTIMQNGPTESILSSGKTLEELFLEMESK